MSDDVRRRIEAPLRVVGCVVLAFMLVVIPTWNPVVARSASARLYVCQLLIGGVIAAGFALRLLRREVRYVAVVAGLASAYLVAQVLLTDRGSTANRVVWGFRPLQPMLLAVAVAGLVPATKTLRWIAVAFGGASIGIVLGVIGWIAPSIDVTKIARPDLGWVSLAGDLPRAIGGFVYPNNFGTFGAYLSVAGLWGLLSRHDPRFRWLSGAAFLIGTAAIAASGNRAGGLGWVAGAIFLGYRYYRSSEPSVERRRLTILGVLGPVLVVGGTLLASPLTRLHGVQAVDPTTSTGFVEDRVMTAAGDSFSIRWADWKRTLSTFVHHPVAGGGVVGRRTDNLFIMYLGAAGILGVVLLVLLARACWFTMPIGGTARRGWDAVTTPRTALLLVGGVSGLLQDSLGQPLATWFPAVLIGLAVIHGRVPDVGGVDPDETEGPDEAGRVAKVRGPVDAPAPR
jgi:hypothetical protein